jgi:large subunit ribosomal protein L49
MFTTKRLFSQAVKKVPLVQPTATKYPYFIPRNSRGSLPVYTDIRNGGSRYLVLVRNVDGDVKVSHTLSSFDVVRGAKFIP